MPREETLENTEEQKPEKKKRRWPKVVLIIVAIPLLIAVGLTGYYFLMAGEDGENGEIRIQDIDRKTLADFTVNLADHRSAYLRTKITLEFTDRDVESELDAKNHRIRNIIIDVVRDKRIADIDSTDGAGQLREELKGAINEELSEGEITGLYFEDFIIQH